MNRKHLRSLAAVQRGKKNARSLEQDLVHFGVIPPGTPRQAPIRAREDERADFQMHNSRLTLTGRNVDFADICGDMLGLEYTAECKARAARVVAAMGYGDPHKERTAQMMDGTPEEFFEFLHVEAGLMTNLWGELNTKLVLVKLSADRVRLQAERQSLVNRITDIALFVIRSKGFYKPGIIRPSQGRITIGGKDYAITPELTLTEEVMNTLKKRAGEEDGE